MTLTLRQQRFIKNVRDNPARGSGDWKQKSYYYPTEQQMNKFEKYNIVYDVDPALRDVVIELNAKGYRTVGSCQGHSKHNKTGFVTIAITYNEVPLKYRNSTTSLAQHLLKELSEKEINPTEIKMIFKKHGITITKYTPPVFNKSQIRNFHSFDFPVIVDKEPSKETIYYYASGSELKLVYAISDIPKGQHYVQLLYSKTSDGKYADFKIIDNKKTVWIKRINMKAAPCVSFNTSLELQQVLHKLLHLHYNEKKLIKDLTADKKSWKKCKIRGNHA